MVKFVAVTEDSRCPLNVNCVWAGVGRVKISLTEGWKNRRVRVNTNQADKSATFEGYIVSLRSLDPYPSGKPIAKGRYTARFNIRKIER